LFMRMRNLPYGVGYDGWDEEWAASLRGQHLGVYGDSVAGQLGGLVAGDSREILVYPIVPVLRSGAARTVSKAWLTVKAKETDADATENAAWSATLGARQSITTTEVAGRGQILSATAPELRFDLTAANTALLNAHQIYYFDVQILMSDNSIYTVE